MWWCACAFTIAHRCENRRICRSGDDLDVACDLLLSGSEDGDDDDDDDDDEEDDEDDNASGSSAETVDSSSSLAATFVAIRFRASVVASSAGRLRSCMVDLVGGAAAFVGGTAVVGGSFFDSTFLTGSTTFLTGSTVFLAGMTTSDDCDEEDNADLAVGPLPPDSSSGGKTGVGFGSERFICDWLVGECGIIGVARGRERA